MPTLIFKIKSTSIKIKIKRKIFKKNTFILKKVNFKLNTVGLSNFLFSLKRAKNESLDDIFIKRTAIVCLSQKTCNTKSTFFLERNLHTFSVGSIVKYIKTKNSKSIRRSIKGTKIFLNFFKNLLNSKYSNNTFKNFFFKLNGFDYNLMTYKKFYSKIYKSTASVNKFFLFNIKVPFTKTKDKKVKSIKKRLKKKILLNFVKNVK